MTSAKFNNEMKTYTDNTTLNTNVINIIINISLCFSSVSHMDTGSSIFFFFLIFIVTVDTLALEILNSPHPCWLDACVKGERKFRAWGKGCDTLLTSFCNLLPGLFLLGDSP